MKTIEGSIKIIDSLQVGNGLYRASASAVYSKMWFRDIFYTILPFMKSPCDRFEKAMHGMLDILIAHEDKITHHTKHKPVHWWEDIHPRYDFEGKEIQEEWGNKQYDAIGAILFGVGEGEKAGKKIIRNEKDRVIVQKLVDYLACCEYWSDPDNGMWEEKREIHMSSVGAVVSSLKSVQDIVNVPPELISKGLKVVADMFPIESIDRPVDLAQLSLIYPYKILTGHDAAYIVSRVESMLLKSRGVKRYQGDRYHSTGDQHHHETSYYYGKEAEWTFGLPWLSLCHMELGDYKKAALYINKTESVMLDNGELPELYYANTNVWNENTPLLWSNAMYILAKERYENGGMKNGR